MKSSSLLSFLRSSFLFLEWVSAISTVLLFVSGLVVAPYMLSTPGRLTFGEPIYRLRLEPRPPLSPLHYRGASPGTVVLQNIRGDLIVKQAPDPGTLLNFVRLRTASVALLLGLSCAVFSLLRRLIDSVRQGEAFSMRSVRQIRGIGWCYLTYSVIASLTSSTLDWVISSDLRRNLTIGGFHTDFIAAPASGGFDFLFGQHHLFLDLNTLWIALLTFVLAEVFRQGVLLKQENDLTV